MSGTVWWVAAGTLAGAVLVWGLVLLRALARRREAERTLSAARAAGDEAAVVVAEQRAADRDLRVQRLTRWVRPGRDKRRAA